MDRYKRIFASLFMVLFVFTLVGQPINAKSTKEEVVPTIFFHGFNGNYKTFQKPISGLQKLYQNQENGAVYDGTVGFLKDGKFVDTRLNKKTRSTKPLIVAALIENKQSISKQLGYFKYIVKYIKKKYNATSVNIVGHSIGGIVALKYVLISKEDDVRNLMTLAAPIKGTRYSLIPYFLGEKNLAKVEDIVKKYPGVEDMIIRSNALTSLDKVLKQTKVDKEININCYRASYDFLVSKKSSFALNNYKNIEVKGYHKVKAYHRTLPEKITPSHYAKILYNYGVEE